MTTNNDSLILIGAVAKSYGVSENCIRRIEADGLLKPAYVSDKSGYRYYNSSDIVQIGTILTLRSFGFTNKDIRAFLENPDTLTDLYHKLQEKQQALTNLIQQFDRRVKNANPYKCSMTCFPEAFYYTKELMMVPNLASFSDIASEAQFEAINGKLPVDYTQPPLIETVCENYRTYDPREEQKIFFHIPLRKQTEGQNITFIPHTQVVEVKWCYPGTDYFKIVPVIEQFFDLFSLNQAGTLRASFTLGRHSVKNADISSTVMHILIPVQ